jgi:hypothetical protein
MRKFSTCLTMNYPFCFVILHHSLFDTKVDIVRLIPFVREPWTRLTKIQGHVESTFQTLFSLSIRVLLLYQPGLSAYLTSWAWAFKAIVYKSRIHQSTQAVWIFTMKFPTTHKGDQPGQIFEDLDRLGLLGTESLRILGFFSDHAKLSALWLRGAWPDCSRMQSYVI